MRTDDDTSELRSGQTQLLTSPLRRAFIGRVFILGGPLGLAIAIVLSLWVSYLHVRHSAIVQVDTTWLPGEQLALRAQIVAEQAGPVVGAGEAWVEQGSDRFELVELDAVGKDGVLQGGFQVPALSPGEAHLHVRLHGEGIEPMRESVPIEVATSRAAREPTHIVSGSTLNYGDDSEPQPPGIRIVVRPHGRVLTGFDNKLYVRVTKLDGAPYEGPVVVELLSGEFLEALGDESNPPKIAAGSTGRIGVIVLEGLLASEVLRLRVRVPSREDPTKTLHQRAVRMVSYAGAVDIVTPPASVTAGQIDVLAYGLSSKRAVFVDVHGADGAYVDTLMPPFVGLEEPRPWAVPVGLSGLVQFEAYHFTNAPGESSAVGRVHVHAAPEGPAAVKALVDHNRDLLDLPRVEAHFDRQLENAYLDWLAKAELSASEVDQARGWLVGTLPVRIYGPPTALATRQREVDALAEKQRRWTIWLRVLLLGGGGLFLGAMTYTMVRAHAQAAQSTAAALQRVTEGDAQIEAQVAIEKARRDALLRGLGVIGVMAAGLVLATVMLESFLWVF